MYVSRMKSIGFEVFKCLRNCSPSYITDMFRISATPYATRDGTKLIQPKVYTTRNGLKSFRYQGAKIWNELPTSIQNTEDVSEFKYRLNKWHGPVCKCGSCDVCKFTWWRHQMETISALLAICAGNSPASGEFPAQRPVTRSFDVFFDLCLNKRLRKQSRGWWFKTLSCPLWRHCNEKHSNCILP